MIKAVLVTWFVLAAAIALAALIVPSVNVDGGFLTLMGVAFIFGLVNGLIGPVVRLLSLPLTVVTFGLFSLVINGALLALTAGLSEGLDVGGFFSTVLAAILISIFSTVIGAAAGMFTGRKELAAS